MLKLAQQTTRRLRGIHLAIPLLVLLVAFFAIPVLELVRRSFLDPDGALTLQSYGDFLGTPAYRTILFRTFFVAVVCTVTCLLFAYPYAYLMTLAGPRLRRALLVLVLLPFWTSLMVRTYAWLVLLQDTGPIKAVLAAIGLEQVHLIRNTTGVVIGMAQILLPFMVLPLYNNLQKIERSDLLAAQSMGATPVRAFWRVYFPQSLPGLFAGSVLVFILALGFYITPVILGSPQNSMMSQLIVRQVTERLDWASGGAMAVVLAVLTLVFVGLMSRVVNVQQAFGGTVDKK
ncbi:ABC transporter permease [Nonomuraea cavernae]|uniref:ABC transporter permease n=1 Tax=Nonomuraea cavernae TaxID=2045107 RepID=A0A917ZA18_9ACTN|nr:ABC transporter permease [Nonomuraea cavernae]MCA2187165.1 ABC transporter permease [Nonomuraea cavernae]GGO79074.1 ABC transporter permease [Nonomuraea cavernae]